MFRDLIGLGCELEFILDITRSYLFNRTTDTPANSALCSGKLPFHQKQTEYLFLIPIPHVDANNLLCKIMIFNSAVQWMWDCDLNVEFKPNSCASERKNISRTDGVMFWWLQTACLTELMCIEMGKVEMYLYFFGWETSKMLLMFNWPWIV